MGFIEHQGLRYYKFEAFDDQAITHGVFTRHGGISHKPWDTLNLGGTVGDSRDNVIENRKRMFSAIGRPVESLYDAWQVHGTEVIIVNQPRPLDENHIRGDALLTNNPRVTLFMRFADCVPILLFDPVKYVVGIVHAGWKGTLAGIAKETIERMGSNYQSNPGDIIAGIGPSICQDHYEVGKDVAQLTQEKFGSEVDKVLKTKNNKTYLNLWEANRHSLIEAGVSNIQVSEICTACDTQNWYSHRGDHGETGRFGAVIGLRQD